MVNDEDFDGLEGSIELIDGHWQLHIPLFLVSQKFVNALPPSIKISDEILEITIPGNIAPSMGIKDGDKLWVGLKDGLFTFEILPKPDETLH